MVALIVIAVALAGLALAAVWFRQEPGHGTRMAALVGGVSAFLIAWGAAIALGKSGSAALATGLAGAAALTLVLLGQVRMIRGFIHRR